jgi:hypothetical protein
MKGLFMHPSWSGALVSRHHPLRVSPFKYEAGTLLVILKKADRLFGGYAAEPPAGLAHMGLDGVLADAEKPGDFLDLMVPGRKAQDFLLAL